MNAQMAYLLGMVLGNGEIQRNATMSYLGYRLMKRKNY